MDSHRNRRTKDQARKARCAHCRQVRFARWFGFFRGDAKPDQSLIDPQAQNSANLIHSTRSI